MAHFDQLNGIVELTAVECRELLERRQGTVGRLAFVDGERPRIMPVNYCLQDARLLFRTTEGAKLDAARDRRPMAFEIDGIDDEARAGWSVVYAGQASVVTDPTLVRLLDRLDLSPYPAGRTRHWVTVDPESVTGRRVVHPYRW
jgi:nitroimidazol reductase NimA-like FMN-containing flavoprotein (pyridoxamine 5'-phosphate oxidase superfamily)